MNYFIVNGEYVEGSGRGLICGIIQVFGGGEKEKNEELQFGPRPKLGPLE